MAIRDIVLLLHDLIKVYVLLSFPFHFSSIYLDYLILIDLLAPLD